MTTAGSGGESRAPCRPLFSGRPKPGSHDEDRDIFPLPGGFPLFQRAGGAPTVAAAARGSLANALTGLIGALGLLRLL